MKKHYSYLVGTIQDPTGLAGSLYSRGIISQSVRDEVQERVDLTTKEKATLLINAVEAQVTTDPSMFQVFMEVLKEEPSLSTIVERMSVFGECACWRIVMLIGHVQCIKAFIENCVCIFCSIVKVCATFTCTLCTLVSHGVYVHYVVPCIAN